ncbi:MAG TPA: hypothetical protein ENN67_00525, partial [Firmicutes bacterium]|nr:hypothetical protein [Bacillota bacterium]
DGYTRWWNSTEFTDPAGIFAYKPGAMGNLPYPSATLNPYKYFADNLSNTAPVGSIDFSKRGTFAATGDVNMREYVIQFPVPGSDPVIKFNYAIDASWDVPDPMYEPTYPIESFSPGAQMQEPFNIVVTDAGSDAFHTSTAFGGTLRLDIEIFDWQSPVNPDGVAGEISGIILEGGPFGSPLDILPMATPMPGSSAVSSVFNVEIDAGLLQMNQSGDFMILGTVQSANPSDYQPQLPGGDSYIYPHNAMLSAYFMTEIKILDSYTPFTVIKPNGGEAWQVNSDQQITWTGGDAFPTVKIEYSKDDFVADIHEIIDSTVNNGFFDWKVPDDQSDTVKIRISSDMFPGVFDVSDEYFAIVAGLDEMVVYAADGPAAGRQIYSIDPEGIGPPYQWTSGSEAFIEGPKLSPCGGYILYTTAGFDFKANIRIINIATGEDKIITPAGYDAVYGDFSHDGTKIVTAVGKFGSPLDLWELDYDGGNIEVLTSGANAWAPAYNFDDTQIYYQNFGDSQLYIYDCATGSITQYTNNGTWNDNPCGSPDGTQIAWATMHNMSTGRHIYVSPVEQWYPPDYVIGFETYIRSPCFSPDGTKIIFDHGGFSGSELAIYDIESETWWNITSNSWGDYMADWGYMIPH